MSRARVIRDLGEAEGHGGCVARLVSPGDLIVDNRGVPRALVMLCPDGCGDILTINLDARSGKAWRTDRRGGRLTVYPSVWRSEGCGAHFIIWRGRVLWCDWREGPNPDDEALTRRVEDALRSQHPRLVEYESLAEALDENPWDVAWACRILVRAGKAQEEGRSRYRLAGGSGSSDRGGWA